MFCSTFSKSSANVFKKLNVNHKIILTPLCLRAFEEKHGV